MQLALCKLETKKIVNYEVSTESFRLSSESNLRCALIQARAAENLPA